MGYIRYRKVVRKTVRESLSTSHPTYTARFHSCKANYTPILPSLHAPQTPSSWSDHHIGVQFWRFIQNSILQTRVFERVGSLVRSKTSTPSPITLYWVSEIADQRHIPFLMIWRKSKRGTDWTRDSILHQGGSPREGEKNSKTQIGRNE